METSVTSDPNPLSLGVRRFSAQAFSLIEVALAIGLLSFALVAVFGLIPAGMSTFRKAMDVSVGSQIAQRVINDAQQSDWAELIKSGATATRYFDDQGAEVDGAATAIYHVKTVIIPVTNVPGGSNADLATVTVQVANNPGNRAITEADGVWKQQQIVPISSYTSFVARNSP